MRQAPIFRKRRPRRSRRFTFFLLTIGILAWLYGLIDFSQKIPGQVDDTETRTDAIVVLTGGSERLEAGASLYQSAMAKKLFISGVNERVQVKDILPIETIRPEEADCCIELGYTASDTIGNARETAGWMTKEGFQSLRLVTANYHMPRSLLEFHHAIPDIKIIPHPVFPKNFYREGWWQRPGSARLVFAEYHKFLLTHLRFFISETANRITSS